MSLYLGNDINSSKIMHMTSGVRSASELKSGELIDTVFHSNLNYIRVNKVQGYITSSILTVSQNVRDQIGNNGWIVVNQNGTCIPAIWGRSLDPDNPVYTPFYGKWDGLSIRLGRDEGTLYGYSFYDLDASYDGPCSIYIFSINILDASFSKIPTYNNDIIVGKGSISIKGFNILDSSYISTNIVNNVDNIVSVFNKRFQFTNTNIVGNAISLISHPYYTAILRENIPIIDSTKNTSMRYRGSKSLYLPGNGGSYAKWKIVTAAVNFDEPIPDNAFVICSLNALNNYPSDNNCFLFGNNCNEVVFGRLAFNTLTHWKISVQVTNTQFILRSYFMVAGSYSILGNTYTIHIFY